MCFPQPLALTQQCNELIHDTVATTQRSLLFSVKRNCHQCISATDIRLASVFRAECEFEGELSRGGHFNEPFAESVSKTTSRDDHCHNTKPKGFACCLSWKFVWLMQLKCFSQVISSLCSNKKKIRKHRNIAMRKQHGRVVKTWCQGIFFEKLTETFTQRFYVERREACRGLLLLLPIEPLIPAVKCFVANMQTRFRQRRCLKCLLQMCLRCASSSRSMPAGCVATTRFDRRSAVRSCQRMIF